MNAINLPALIIFPLFLGIYWLTRKHVLANNLILLCGGYLIYAWGNLWWGALLLAATLLDYALMRHAFPDAKFRQAALWLGILTNVAIWLFFKYPLAAGWLINIETQIALPLGMSFYMLRKISFLVQWRHQEENVVSFLEYALYVSFIPQLFSGPIEKPQALLPQIRQRRKMNWKAVVAAGSLLMAGLFKKIVVADNLRIIVSQIFSIDLPSRLLLATGSLAYTFEILADFSAYTDFSRGAALLLGFETSENFNDPYLALTPQDFWNRWHITFSHWLRDTIFFPLRRMLLNSPLRRSSTLVLALPPLVTMLLSGIWHGTGWNYLLWGLYYGLLIVLYQVLGIDAAIKRAGALKVLGWPLMFTLIVAGWGLFRAPTAAWFFTILASAPWGFSGVNLIAFIAYIPAILLFILPIILQTIINRSGRFRSFLQPVFGAAAMVALVVFIGSGLQDFVYFRF